MGRYLEASCKICRRNKVKLFLKGARCETSKCAIEKRNYPPGPKTAVVRKVSEYGKRLREKQKLRFFYGVSEAQMRNYFKKALAQKGVTGHNLLSLFEKRLDNILVRAKLAVSRKEARQLIRHGHFRLNKRKATIASLSAHEGDVISIKEASFELLKARIDLLKEKGLPTWLAFDETEKSVKLLHNPKREEIDSPVQEQLVVEFYSM
jgi:small subunit ribosomal protein S4